MTGSRASLRPEMVLTRWVRRVESAKNRRKKERKEKNDGGRKCSGDNRPSRVPIDGTQLLVEIVTR